MLRWNARAAFSFRGDCNSTQLDGQTAHSTSLNASGQARVKGKQNNCGRLPPSQRRARLSLSPPASLRCVQGNASAGETKSGRLFRHVWIHFRLSRFPLRFSSLMRDRQPSVSAHTSISSCHAATQSQLPVQLLSFSIALLCGIQSSSRTRGWQKIHRWSAFISGTLSPSRSTFAPHSFAPPDP